MAVEISKKDYKGHWNLNLESVRIGHIKKYSTTYDSEYWVYGYYDGNQLYREEHSFLLGRFDSLKEAKTFVKSSLSNREEFTVQMMKQLGVALEQDLFKYPLNL